MAKLLLNSPDVWTPGPNGEGQWLPEVESIMRHDPWNPAVDFDWPRIRECWERLRPPNGTIMLDKSPPNIVRAAQIVKAFPDSFFVISVRNPYAWISSHRAWITSGRRSPQVIDLGAATTRSIALDWLMRAKYQIGNVELLRGRSLVCNYETFCLSPNLFLQNIYNIFGDLKIDPRASLQIKDYAKQRIENMNARQIANLSGEDVEVIGDTLRHEPSVLSFFGYEITEVSGPGASTGQQRLIGADSSTSPASAIWRRFRRIGRRT